MNKVKKHISILIAIILTLGFSISLQSLLAAWSAPTAVAPANNAAAPINVGTDAQTKYGSLLINSGNSTGLYVGSGNVGIGNVPLVKLDVNGEIRTGYTGVTCSLSIEGASRYNFSTKSMQYCDGIDWREYYPEYPAGLSFADLSGQNLNALVSSNVVIPTNYQRSAVAVSSVGSSSPQVSCNGGAWEQSCMLQKGQTLQVRMTTAGSYLSTSTAVLTMGASSATWNAVTKANAMVNCQAWYDAGYTTDGAYLIDPDGAGPINSERLYCLMSRGRWTLVVGIDAANQNHMNTGAVTPGNLYDINGKGKVNDAFINAVQNSGKKQLALEGIGGFRYTYQTPEGFSDGQAAGFNGCNFGSLTGQTTPYCSNWNNSGQVGVGTTQPNVGGISYCVNSPGYNGVMDFVLGSGFRALPGRLWAR